MATLSLSMIVKNEAANLARCLESVRGLVDEMVVVDTGSTDATVAIAQSFGARVETLAWTGDFARARNHSLGLCTGDWALVLDADEGVDPLDHPAIRQACRQDRVPAYYLTIRNYVLDGSGLMMDQPVLRNDGKYRLGAEFSHFAGQQALRLCRRLPGLAYEGRIHEILDYYFRNRHLAIGTLDAVIHHFGKVDPEREATKRTLYLRMAQDEVARQPANAQFQYNLMVQASVANDWKVVIAAARAYLRLSTQPSVTAQVLLAIALQGDGQAEASIPVLERALALQPGHPTALCRLAFALAAGGRREAALASLEQAIDRHPGLPMVWEAMVTVLDTAGDQARAQAVLRRAIQACPGEPALWSRLVDLDQRAGLKDQAIADAWAAIRALPNGGGGQWHVLVAEGLLALGHAQQAGLVAGLGRQAFPDHPELARIAARIAEG